MPRKNVRRGRASGYADLPLDGADRLFDAGGKEPQQSEVDVRQSDAEVHLAMLVEAEQRVDVTDRGQRAADLLDQRDLLLFATQRGRERLHRI